MSKPVRIRQDVVDRVGLVAESERRSLANMVEVLLLAALTERDASDGLLRDPGVGVSPRGPSDGDGVARSASAVTPDGQDGGVRSRPHMKRDRPAVECPTRWPSGTCPDCGTVV